VALTAVIGVGVMGAALGASQKSATLAKTAAEVLVRNAQARGGLDAWRKVNTIVWFGHLEREGRTDGLHVPFVMQLQRPNRTRFEIKEQYNQFTRIFDGEHGWKVRPGTSGQSDVKSFSKEEVNYSRDEFTVDGPLLDYQAKGVTIELDGVDLLDGHQAYRVSLKLASGVPRKVWIDVETNLEVRYDRPATSPLAPGAPVSVYYGSYLTVGGLKIPGSIEVRSAPNAPVHEKADKLIIDRVALNPKLDDQTFLPPPMPMRHGGKISIPSDGMPTGGPNRTGP
jgi:hypothetical protein